MGATNAAFLIKDCWATAILEGDLATRDKCSSSYGASTWLNSTEQKYNYDLLLENSLKHKNKSSLFFLKLHLQFPFEDFTFKVPLRLPTNHELISVLG